MSEWADS